MSGSPSPMTGSNSHEASVHIRTVLSDTGAPVVQLILGDIITHFTPDAAVNVALNLLSAAYASRGEQAAFKYAIDNNIDPQTLIKYIRNITP